jgi:two-component system, OmpR family, sensor kinase
VSTTIESEGHDGRRGASETASVAPTRIGRFKPLSIRISLTAASLLFLSLVIGLGAFSLQRLSDVNRVSDEIRNQWLQDVRLIGDLNNYMSDYRTAEGTHLLSSNNPELKASDQEIAALNAHVVRAQRSFESLPHENAEQQLYDEFARQWAAYQIIAEQVLARSRADNKLDAIALYKGQSRHAFDLASDTLGRLTEQTVAKAHEASARAANAYIQDRRLIVAAMIVAACLVLVTIIYITRSVSRPLLNLARSMRALATHDTTVNIVGSQRGDEIGEMARSVGVFRENAVALVKSQRQLLEQTVALEATLENERRVTAQQRNFVTLTSHEFRTPLTVIDAQAQRLIKLKDRITAEDLANRATRIRSAVTRLTGIMDSLLGASRLLDGQAVFHRCSINPTALLHEVCQLHRETSRGSDIREDLYELPSVIEGDPKLLFALFSNLLSNAIKYSAAGSPIEFIARTDGDGGLLVSVRDRGIGIPESDRARLFERYFRGANAVSISGSGVGLHLVAMVLELHGGLIEVDSCENVGSTFSVRLPVGSQSHPSVNLGAA